MKRIRLIILGAVVALLGAASLASCKGNEEKSIWEEYADWREFNEEWLAEQATLKDDAGKPVYTRVTPAWNKNAYVLMRWFNDTTKTQANLRPLYTSTVDVKYIGHLCNDQAFDSSYVSISPADSVARFRVNGVISGWTIAMERMHVGDSVEVIVPYEQGYGSGTQGLILPYSALRFNIKLVNVAAEYIRP